MTVENSRHIYLVGYLHSEGFGRAILHLNEPICSEAALVDAESLFVKKNGFGCSIFTYQLIEVRSQA